MPRQGIEMTAPAWPAAPGLDPRDAMAMDELREAWGSVYDIGLAGGSYCAMWLLGGELLAADTPQGLESAIKADWSRRKARAAGAR